MASRSKQRSQGGGRKANSEPRQQLFKGFGGCNFELSPREFTLGKDEFQEQSDLQMNYVIVQDNVGVTSNQTLETRNNIKKLCDAPEGTKFTGPGILIGGEIYLAADDGNIKWGNVSDEIVLNDVVLTDKSDAAKGHDWQGFAYADSKLIGTTRENQLWTGTIGKHELSNAKKVEQPPALTIANLDARGQLEISASMDDDSYPYRVAIAYSYINKYGPTEHSDQFSFYANYPVDEWNGAKYLQVNGDVPSDSGVIAVELYYTTGNSSSLLFAGRSDFSEDASTWIFNWFGYLDATTMWPVANLIAPTDNYTEGVPASHVRCIDSRLYFWGNSEQPQRLYIGGNSGNLFSVSSGTGGGFIDIEPGTNQEIRFVDKYKTQSGNSIITMLCDSANTAKEQRFNLVENSVSLSNEQSMKSWQAEQVAGAVGCKSYNGAIVCEDGLYSISRYGLALTTMTMEYNSQIKTNYISDPIKPVFLDKNRSLLKSASIIECDNVLYIAFGKNDKELDNMLFCYDIDLKAWWTITLDLDNESKDEAIVGMFHIDYEGYREGIGIVTENSLYLLPLTQNDMPDVMPDFNVVIQTGELSTQQPQQNWQYLSQLEFRFDYFIGTVLVELTGIDQFGRRISTRKRFTHDTAEYNLAEYMRVDLRLQSYQIRITGTARFRLSHFIAKVYTMSAKQGLVWGFDSSQSHRRDGDIHPTFLDYNDIKKAIIP